MNTRLDKPALYYPYIHIRSEHWLKATLLCAPIVKRIVPDGYTPEDLPRITKYTQIIGRNGPLLQAVPESSSAAYEAQEGLLDKIREHKDEIQRRYQRGHAPGPDEYWIHVAKFNHSLLDFLATSNLAWPSEHSAAYGHRVWYALHPVLGSAIMTTLGLSIAREQRYDIVTPSTDFHETLLTSDQGAIFDVLLTQGKQKPVSTTAQTRRDLGELVITLTGINYKALRPEDIPDLQESKNFHKFQHLIRTRAQGIDREDDLEGYRAQLACEAEEIIEAWQETKNDIGKGLKDALFDAGLILSRETLKTLIGQSATNLVIAGGASVALVVRKGLLLGKKHRKASPYQYLTEIVQAQDEHLRMTFPLGIE